MTEKRVDCRTCVHFRSAPYEARKDGCYFPDNMPGKQGATYLDEQQVPGRHDKINLHGDCKDHAPRPKAPSFVERLLKKF